MRGLSRVKGAPCRLRGLAEVPGAATLDRLQPEPVSHGTRVALDGRELRVGIAALEARDGGLRGGHPSGQRSLGQTRTLARAGELTYHFPPLDRRGEEVSNLRASLRALADELVERVFSVLVFGQPSIARQGGGVHDEEYSTRAIIADSLALYLSRDQAENLPLAMVRDRLRTPASERVHRLPPRRRPGSDRGCHERGAL